MFIFHKKKTRCLKFKILEYINIFVSSKTYEEYQFEFKIFWLVHTTYYYYFLYLNEFNSTKKKLK